MGTVICNGGFRGQGARGLVTVVMISKNENFFKLIVFNLYTLKIISIRVLYKSALKILKNNRGT